MLRFPAISRSINGHQCKLLWLKPPPSKGRMDAGASAEIKGSERSHWKAPLGSLAWKGSFLTAPGAPGSPWALAAPSSAGGSCLQRLPGSPHGSGVCGAGRGDRSTGQAEPAGLLQGVLQCPPGRWGTRKADLSTLLSWSPWTQFHRSAEFGEFLVSHRVAMVMTTILQGWRTSSSLSSGKGLASGELGDAADVRLSQPFYSCSQYLPTNKIFKNRSELSLSALFLIFSPLKNLSLLFWASENVTALMPLLCYYTGNEIYSWKSINSKGDIHLYESSQLERKTWGSISLL